MIEHDGRTVRLSGPVTLETAIALRTAIEEWLVAGELEIDLGAVTEVDSSALSLLLEWRRLALKRQAQIRYKNLPANLTSLAVLYGIEDLITEHNPTTARA